METSSSSSTSGFSSSSSSSSSNSDPQANSSSADNTSNATTSTSTSAYGNGMRQLPFLNFFQSPIPALLEYSGLLRPTTRSSRHYPSEAFPVNGSPTTSASTGEVSIRIDDDNEGVDAASDEAETDTIPLMSSPSSSSSSSSSSASSQTMDAEAGDVSEASSSSHQRHDLQHLARCLEHILPFSLLLLVVFIRQHLQGFFLTIWIAAVLFKCNNILQKQTALKGERKISVLVSISVISILHVVGVYCWYQNDDLVYPLVMLPPKEVPPFWHAIFIIMVNDTMVRQVAMIFKCLLLMYYKNGRGKNFRRQGQMLTLIEYAILLYRALLPTPIWYWFFLGNDYGSLFSSLTTGLYLTFKLTFVVEKVQTFYAAIKALSQKDIHYGSHATSEQVNAVGDLCAICQEKMRAPILLRCKHIFCEDCVSEWLERERTCPLCRAVVKPTDLQSYGDGSTSLFFQLF